MALSNIIYLFASARVLLQRARVEDKRNKIYYLIELSSQTQPKKNHKMGLLLVFYVFDGKPGLLNENTSRMSYVNSYQVVL